MSDAWFDEEVQALQETCARLHEELKALRERIDGLEAIRDALESQAAGPPPPERPTTPPTSPVIPVPDTGPQHRPVEPSEAPPFALPVEPSHVFIPTPAGRKAPGTKPKDISELAHRLVSGESEPADEAIGQAGGMELRIGGTWLNRAGAIILFLAVAFFAKYSFDQGWISPAMRIVLAGAVGLIMVGLGEYSLHRAMRTFAAGLLGGGVCILYLAIYGAHGFYNLIGTQTAFVLYIGVTALSVLISVHGRVLPVAILGVIGGFATPLVLSTGRNQQIELLTYVLAIDLGFLICASIRRWDVLRMLSWLGTLILFSGWYIRFYQEAAMWQTAGFVLAFYLLFHTEAIVSLLRRSTEWPRFIGYIIHANNAVFFAAIYFLLGNAVPQWMGLFAVSTAGLQWLAAWRLCGGHSLAAPARMSLWLSGAAMLALAAPMQFDRYMVSLSWAVQAVVTLWFCRRVDSVWVRVKGTGILLAAAAHLLIFDYYDEPLTQVLLTLGQWHLSWIIVCFVFVGLCGYAGAVLLSVRRTVPEGDLTLSILLTIFGTCMLLGIFSAQWERYLASWWWLGLGVAWWVLALRVAAARPMAVALMFAVLVKFITWDTFHAAALGSWETIDGLVLNRAVVTGAMVAALGGLVRPMADRWPEPGKQALEVIGVGPVVTVAVALVITWTGTFEVHRAFRFESSIVDHFQAAAHAQGVFITAYWALNAAALWLLVRSYRPALSGYALALTWVVMIKMMVVDTLSFAVAGFWRELAGVGTNRTFLVGILVIGVALLGYRQYRRAALKGRTWVFTPEMLKALLVAATLLIIWVPTFEICRVFSFEEFRHRFADPRLAMHVVLSVFWSLNATLVLMLGFLRQVALLRHMALGLFAVTVAKVFIFDLGHLEMVYRIISFMVLGVLLLFASYLYQRLSSRLSAGLADATGSEEETRPSS